MRAVTDGFGTGDRTRSHGSQDGVGDGRDSDSGESGCATLHFFFLWPAGIRKRKKNIEVILSISFNYMALIVTYKRGSIY